PLLPKANELAPPHCLPPEAQTVIQRVGLSSERGSAADSLQQRSPLSMISSNSRKPMVGFQSHALSLSSCRLTAITPRSTGAAWRTMNATYAEELPGTIHLERGIRVCGGNNSRRVAIFEAKFTAP